MNEIKCPNCGQVFKIDESVFKDIVKQIRDQEFEKEISERSALLAKDKESAVRLVQSEAENRLKSQTAALEKKITELSMQLKTQESEKKLAVNEALAQLEKKLSEKEKLISSLQNENQLQLKEQALAVSEAVRQIEKERDVLQVQLQAKAQEQQLQQASLKSQYEAELRRRDELIAYYKDFKARQSTKMIGESLEQHCETEFNQLRATGFQNAYFEKDNDIRTGSKGDYIYREADEEGNEIISIMFEMKNEQDETSSKKKMKIS